ncbi:MAG: hypothetical protein ABIN97_19620 [Ginsengibacter sp.]
MHKTIIILLISLTGLILAGKKPVSSMVITTVKGFAMDTVKNKRLPNATVIINGPPG